MSRILYAAALAVIFATCFVSVIEAQTPTNCSLVPGISSGDDKFKNLLNVEWMGRAFYNLSTTWECMRSNISLVNGNIQINMTYAQKTDMAKKRNLNSVQVATADNNGYNLTLTEGSKSDNITYIVKFINVTSDAFCMCLYNENSSWALVSTKMSSNVNASTLQTFVNDSSTEIYNMTALSNTTITQSDRCFRSGAATTVPVLTALFALVYAVLKFLH